MKQSMKKPSSKQKTMNKSKDLVIGIIRGTHGLSGTMKIESTSGEIDHFFSLKEVRVKKENHSKEFKVLSVFGATPLLLQLDGIESQEEAKKLVGSEILVPRDMACPLYEDEYYVEDLKESALLYLPSNEANAKDASTELDRNTPILVGYITDVVEGGSGQLLEVALTESVNLLMQKPKDTEKTQKVFIPFRKEFIGTVDIAKKEVQLMHLWILE
ncbi:MAG TPA: ribosome maturation factor RimM [Treponemataceae bacterium]|nr:ribosome maturation factor RimM [Treponemataceae bacterium]